MRNKFFLFALCALTACTTKIPSSHVWLTSEAGDQCAEQSAVVFHKGTAADAIVVNPDEQRQTIDGFTDYITGFKGWSNHTNQQFGREFNHG